MKTTLVTILISTAFVLSARAQTAQGAASEVQQSTDPARAAAVERHALELKARAGTQPQVFVRGETDTGLPFVSGGNTVEDRVTMHSERDRYNMWVATVAKPSGAYLADAKLRIVKVADESVVHQRTMEGPWFLVALPPGKYDVSATYRAEGSDRDQTLTNRVSIPKTGQRQAVFRFASDANVSTEMDSPFRGNPFGVQAKDR